MARRSETGGWRSQTRFESRPGETIPNTEHGQPPSRIAEAPLDVAPEQDRRLAQPDAVRIPPWWADPESTRATPTPSGPRSDSLIRNGSWVK
jgi:hypothetical protein